MAGSLCRHELLAIMFRSSPKHRFGVLRRKAPRVVLALILVLLFQDLSQAIEPVEPRLDADATNQVWAPGGSSWSSEGEEPTYLVGVVIQGREKGSAEVVRKDEDYLLPLETFASLTGARIDEAEGAPILVTSLGAVDLSGGLVEVESVYYLHPDFIESELSTPIRFDESEFALRLNPPWRPLPNREPPPVGEGPHLDAVPPSFSLSRLRFDASRIETNDDTRYVSESLLTGRLATGRWRVRYADNFADFRDMREYAWTKTHGRQLYLVGLQRFALYPILPAVELTGLQVGWTNKPLDMFAEPTAPGELLPRQVRASQSFRGQGPPGGVAELRIDGVVIQRQTIPLSGQYEFLDVPGRGFQSQRVEVYVYDRANLAAPVSIEEFRESASEYLLGKGVQLHVGGFGEQGSLVRDALQDRDSSGETAGFYQGRIGLSDNLIVESTVQDIGDRSYYLAGLVSRLPGGFVTTFGVAESDSAWAYNFTLENRLDRGWVRGLSQVREEGFVEYDSSERWDHFLELGVNATPKLDLWVVGRSLNQVGREADFVLPGFFWRPRMGYSVRGLPDAEGNYTVDLLARLAKDLRFSANWRENRRDVLSLSYDRWRQTRLYATSELDGGLPDRHWLGVDWQSRGPRLARAYGALVYSDDEMGFRVGGQMAILPGVLGRIEYFEDPLNAALRDERSERFLLGVTVDLASSHGGIVPGNQYRSRRDRGSIAGRVRVDAPAGYESEGLAGITVLVNGAHATKTAPGGVFFAGNLEPGDYLVELDTEDLPIELVPTENRFTVRVAEEGVTRVDFVVSPEFGLAGRLTDSAGQNLRGVTIELIAGDGGVLRSARTDRFGLFRVDGVPIGTYTLRVATESFPSRRADLPSRRVEISDDYKFGQDLQLPFPVVTEGDAN